MEHDVPKALDVLTQVLVTDVLGEWLFRSNLPVPENSIIQTSRQITPEGGALDIHLTPARAHAHAKTAHYISSSAFTSSIARLFAALPLGHPSRDTTIRRFHSHSKLVYPNHEVLKHEPFISIIDTSLGASSPIVQRIVTPTQVL